MNVLLITLRSDVGGGPKHVCQLLQNVGEDVCYYMAAPVDEPFGSVFMSICGGERYFILPHRRFSFKSLLYLRKFCLINNIKVVHSHGKGAGIYSRLLKIINPSIRVIHTFHGVHVGEYSSFVKFLYSSLEYVLSFFTHHIIAVSDSERHSIDALLFYRFTDKIHVIRNGVYIPDSFPEKKSARTKKFTIVVVSRFDYQKNTNLLVDILTKLDAYGALIDCCYVLGDGQERYKVLQLLGQDMSYRIECPGAVSVPNDYYIKSDIILNTSRWEGLSLSVLEGMAYGAIPVLTNVTGNCDVLSCINSPIVSFCFYELNKPQDAVNNINSIFVDDDLRHGVLQMIKDMMNHFYDEREMALKTTLLYK